MARNKLHYSTEYVDVTMHLLDKNSTIIKQNPDLSLPVNPEFITMHIERKSEVNIIGLTFADWQYITTRLYSTVKGQMMIQPNYR